jgi:hypothetical protein
MSFYTDAMKRAVHSIETPKNFGVDIYEHSENGMLMFLEVVMDERRLVQLSHDDKIAAVIYTMRVKDALEKEGAVVQVTRREMQ